MTTKAPRPDAHGPEQQDTDLLDVATFLQHIGLDGVEMLLSRISNPHDVPETTDLDIANGTPINADISGSTDLDQPGITSEEEALAGLDRLGEAATERESTNGTPAIQEDLDLDKFLTGRVAERFPNARIATEESDAPTWNAFVQPGSKMRFQLDPLDGSVPAMALGFGFGVTAGCYLGDHLAVSVTVNSSRQVLALVGHRVYSTYDRAPLRVLTDPRAGSAGKSDGMINTKPGTVAVVAALAPARENVAPLFDPTLSWGLPTLRYSGKDYPDPGLTVFTTGGAPAAHMLAAGQLQVLVCPNPQAVHDAFPLAALAVLGLPCFDDDGLVPAEVFLEDFEAPQRPRDPGYLAVRRCVFTAPDAESRRIGELIAARVFHRRRRTA